MRTRFLTATALTLAGALATHGALQATPLAHDDHHSHETQSRPSLRGVARTATARARGANLRARRIGGAARGLRTNARALRRDARAHGQQVLRDLVHGVPGALGALDPRILPEGLS